MNAPDPENSDAVSLAEAVEHPAFSPALRGVIFMMAEHPGKFTLDEILHALGMDPREAAERFVAEAIGTEVLRCREVDAAKAKGLN